MPQDRTGREFSMHRYGKKIGRHDIEADRANDVAPRKKTSATVRWHLIFSGALTNGSSAPADNRARKARARESYAMADNIVIWR